MGSEGFQVDPSEQTNQRTVDVYDQTRLRAELPRILPELMAVTTNALGEAPEDMQEVIRSFNLIVAIREAGRIVGYGGYDILDVPEVGRVLNQSRMIRKDVQSKGYGEQITREALALHPEAAYLTFTTQNPNAVASIRKALDGKPLAPIDVTYQESEEMQGVLKRIARKVGRAGMDITTGVRKRFFPGKKFGDYAVDQSNPSIAFVEQRLAATGFQRERGDGVFCIAKLKDASPAPTNTISHQPLILRALKGILPH